MTNHQLINATSGITEYYSPDRILNAAREAMDIKRGVTKGSVIHYIGTDVGRFAECFKELGSVTVPHE